MYGLVFEIVEEWVIKEQGLKTWHAIKDTANCKVKDKAFLRRSYYPDEELVDIVAAASEVLGIEIPVILEAFGHFVIRHHYANGYDDLLRCLGSNLRQWLSNLNAMHDHIQETFEDRDKFVSPIFWCEDCDTVEGSILLHYYSLRGLLLVPMVVGIVEELASFQFDVEVKMTQIALQGENGAEFTSWRITAVDPSQRWRLSPQSEEFDEKVSFENVKMPNRCPYSGIVFSSPNPADSSLSTASNSSMTPSLVEGTSSPRRSSTCSTRSSSDEMGLSLRELKAVFPFHVLVDHDFTVLQVGKSLPDLLDMEEEKIHGKHISSFLDISRPVLGSAWNWKALQKLEDQHFFIVPKRSQSDSLHKKVSMADSAIKFKTTLIKISYNKVMFVMSPDARNVEELNAMGLTMSDLPLNSCQRDTIFLGEYITQEVNKAHDLDKLSKKLENEKNLSNTLLYNMLPMSVADTLRAGQAVEPEQYENVTLFFSDIEGFTSICDKVDPSAVIAMLNQLYTVMDYLSALFDLYKVETIGDAYMCCSGLPNPVPDHAEKIADYAIAVMECVKHIKSPLDGAPINLRIGIHTGSCTAGVVGTLTPHYCLFGDMVNTTSRHESTGVAGKVQCSSILFGRLKHFSTYEKEQYNFTPRGLVNMKGKGDCYTYWLECGTEDNARVNPTALEKLSQDVSAMLSCRNWKRRRYFRRGGALRKDTMSDVGTVSTASLASGSSGGIDDVAEVKSVGSEEGCNRSLQDDMAERDLKGFEDILDETACTSHDETNDITITDNCSTVKLSCNNVLIDRSWTHLELDPGLTRKSLISKVQQHLSSILSACISASETADHVDSELDRMSQLDTQLRDFVVRISKLYSSGNRYYNFERACNVFFRASFLAERADVLVGDRWNQFVLVFSALIHGIKHPGLTSDQITQADQCPFHSSGTTGQVKQSLQYGLDIFADDFPELYDEVIWGCPRFMHLVRKASLAINEDIEKVLDRFRRSMEVTTVGETKRQRAEYQKIEAALELLMILADNGHYSQSYELFLKWNKADFEDRQLTYIQRKGSNPSTNWFQNQIEYFKDTVLPIIEQSEKVLLSFDGIRESAEANLIKWELEGRSWGELVTHGAVSGYEYYYFQ